MNDIIVCLMRVQINPTSKIWHKNPSNSNLLINLCRWGWWDSSFPIHTGKKTPCMAPELLQLLCMGSLNPKMRRKSQGELPLLVPPHPPPGLTGAFISMCVFKCWYQPMLSSLSVCLCLPSERGYMGCLMWGFLLAKIKHDKNLLAVMSRSVKLV